jgi:hypothetical protein
MQLCRIINRYVSVLSNIEKKQVAPQATYVTAYRKRGDKKLVGVEPGINATWMTITYGYLEQR